MNQEQRTKAKMALLSKHLGTFEQRIAISNHYQAIRWIYRYNLPYRISLDYIKAWDRRKGFVMINDNYPLPGYAKDKLMVLNQNQITFKELHPKEEDLDFDYKTPLVYPISEALEKQIDEICDKLRPWNFETAAGRKVWEREFAHFLSGYQLNTFTLFDWFGTTDNETTEEKQKKISYWIDLQKDYLRNPSNYRTEEPLFLEEYEDIYTDWKYLIDWGNKLPYIRQEL